MALDSKDTEVIERILYRSAHDIGASITRSFGQLEQRIDAAESRLYSRLADVEDRVDNSRQEIADELGEVRAELREVLKAD